MTFGVAKSLTRSGSIAYFKDMAEETGIPYQSLINLYLKECAATGRQEAEPVVAILRIPVIVTGQIGNVSEEGKAQGQYPGEG